MSTTTSDQQLPWYCRSSILLAIGAGAIVLSLVVALVARRDGSEEGPVAASKGGAAKAGGTGAERGWDLSWVFNDPNRALGDGTDSLETRTAVWALDTGVVVAGVDNVRGHGLGTGAARWQHPVDGQVCSAAAGVPTSARVVVIGEGENCSTLTAINARTGRTAWRESVDDIFVFQSIVMAKVGVVTLGMHGVSVFDAKDGSTLRTIDDDAFTAKAGVADGRVIPDGDMALSADGSTVVVPGRFIGRGDDEVEPGWAFGLDAKTGRLRWATQLGRLTARPVPQAHDGTFIVVGDEESSTLFHLDARTGKVRSQFPIPAEDDVKGEAGYERYPFGGPAWYRSGTVFVGGDPVVTYDGAGDLSLQDLVRIDAETGKERWRLRPQDIDPPKPGESVAYTEMAAGPVLEDGNLLVHVGRAEGSFLVEVDPKTGKVVRKEQEPDAIGTSTMAHQPAIQLVHGGIVMAYNPGGGTNQVDESAEEGEDTVSLAFLEAR
jgi:outer membrane protein assembly factor BamB